MILPKPDEVANVAAVPTAVTEREPLGDWKLVWLMTLKASTRNWKFRASHILKSFETEASKSTSPGARLESRETFPKPVATICVRTPLMVL